MPQKLPRGEINMKKMKERAKGFVVGVLMMALLTPAVLAANPGGVFREVFYDVNIVVNGTAWNPPADMVPFITGGRTFLPVRGIAELLGTPVDWDGATRTVFVGTAPHGAPFWATVPFFQRSHNDMTTRTLTSIGQSYANAISIGGRNRFSTTTHWSDHALNGQFNTLTGTIGQVDGTHTAAESTISFIGDGRELATFNIGGTDHPRDISVDVRGVLVLRVQIQQNHGRGGDQNVVFLANAMIY
jgi:hypothetical protein